jgi:hypothetical protein
LNLYFRSDQILSDHAPRENSFAQLMMFIPDHEFQKCADHYNGNYRVRSFSCREHFLVMSFAQLAGRKSLRDIGNGLTPFPNKLYHSGIKNPVSKSTLADANEKEIGAFMPILPRF